jgi:hypothetical protein
MPDERTFIKVHDGIEDHPKIATLSDRAFRVLVTTWGWCARNETDGLIREAVWKKRAPKRVRDELEVELVHRPGHSCTNCAPVPAGHVKMHDYLEHQRSAAEIEEKRELKRLGGRKGNHNRWHRDLGKYDPECELCRHEVPPEPSQKRSHKRSPSDRNNGHTTDRKTSPEIELEKEITTYVDQEAHVGNARGASGPNSTTAFRLVERTLGRNLTSATKTALAIQVATLLPEVDEPTLSAALKRWDSRTGIGAGLLPGLVDDIRKEARGATTRAAPPSVNATDAFAAQFLAGGNRPPELRALPGGAS